MYFSFFPYFFGDSNGKNWAYLQESTDKEQVYFLKRHLLGIGKIRDVAAVCGIRLLGETLQTV